MELLTTKEVAAMLKVRVATVQEYIRDGRDGVFLVASRLGAKRYRIDRRDLEAFLTLTRTQEADKAKWKPVKRGKSQREIDKATFELRQKKAHEQLREFGAKK